MYRRTSSGRILKPATEDNPQEFDHDQLGLRFPEQLLDRLGTSPTDLLRTWIARATERPTPTDVEDDGLLRIAVDGDFRDAHSGGLPFMISS